RDNTPATFIPHRLLSSISVRTVDLFERNGGGAAAGQGYFGGAGATWRGDLRAGGGGTDAPVSAATNFTPRRRKYRPRKRGGDMGTPSLDRDGCAASGDRQMVGNTARAARRLCPAHPASCRSGGVAGRGV